MRTVLVTGATGFIGSHLVPRLTHRGDRVRALVRPRTDASELEQLDVEVFRGDVRDERAVERAVSGCEVVVHLAGRTVRSKPRARELKSVNQGATATVARAAARAAVERLVLASSTSVYGVTRNRRIDEETDTAPHSAYGKSKLRSEEIALDHYRREGVGVVIARITSTLGAGTPAWLELFRAVAAGRFRLIGSGDNHVHHAAVGDIADGLLLCADRGADGKTYVLAGREALPLREMMEAVAAQVGAPPVGEAMPRAPLRIYKWLGDLVPGLGDALLPRFNRVEFFLNDRAFDTARARRELGYAPETTLKEAIRETVRWYSEEGLLEASPRQGLRRGRPGPARRAATRR